MIAAVLVIIFLQMFGIIVSTYTWNYFSWIAGISLLEIIAVKILVSKIQKPSPLIFLAAEMIKMLALMIVFVVYAVAFGARSTNDAIAFGGLSVYFLAASAFILIRIVREISVKEK